MEHKRFAAYHVAVRMLKLMRPSDKCMRRVAGPYDDSPGRLTNFARVAVDVGLTDERGVGLIGTSSGPRHGQGTWSFSRRRCMTRIMVGGEVIVCASGTAFVAGAAMACYARTASSHGGGTVRVPVVP